MTVCASCGPDSAPDARFCSACGTQLAEAVPQREVRKTFTVLSCDVSGSTSLGEQLDHEAAPGPAPLLRRDQRPRRAARRHRGEVHPRRGHGGLRRPAVQEDDAPRMLAEALFLNGESAEAERLARSIGAETPDDVQNVILAGHLLARILAQHGQLGEAKTRARAAVAVALETDAPVLRGDALLALAHVLRTSGAEEEARNTAGRSLAEYERKGYRAGAKRARAFAQANLRS